MALTIEQLVSIGFKPSVRGRGGLSKTKKYDSLVLPLNDTDFLYTGFNPFKNQVNYKTIWKSFKDTERNRITYQVVNLADTGFLELKNYIDRSILLNAAITYDLPTEDSHEKIHSSATTELYNGELCVEEGSERANKLEPSELPLTEEDPDIVTEAPKLD